MAELTTERDSNYDKTRDEMEREFLRYDQDAMLRKFDLRHDEDYFYLRMLAREHRLDRRTGRIEWLCEESGEYVHADFNASMAVFDILAYSKEGCCLSGQFVPTGSLSSVVATSGSSLSLFSRQSSFFAGRGAELEAACLRLGGTLGGVGDVAATLPLFEFFPVQLQFWDEDEEFEASLQFFWDANATDYMHFETIAFSTGYLLSRLKECMGAPAEPRNEKE